MKQNIITVYMLLCDYYRYLMHSFQLDNQNYIHNFGNNYKYMGDVAPTMKSEEIFDPQNWKQITPKNNYHQSVGLSSSSRRYQYNKSNASLLKAHPNYFHQTKYLSNKLTGEEVIQYQMLLNDQDQYKQNISEYGFRKQHKKYLIAPKYFHIHKKKQMCSTSYTLKVFFQKLSLTLTDLNKIPLEDFIYIMETSLEGFQILYDRYGVFQIHSDVIGINSEGVIKVWMNQNFSKNWPLFSASQRIFSLKPENKMIRELIQIVEQRVDWQLSAQTNRSKSIAMGSNRSLCTLKFSDYIKNIPNKQSQQLSFSQTISLLKQYSIQLNIVCPKFVTSILKKIRENKGIFDSQIMSSNQFDSKFKFKESEVFPVRTQHLNFMGGDYKNSVIRSQSNQTFADRLYNKTQSRSIIADQYFDTSKNRQSSIFQNATFFPRPSTPLSPKNENNTFLYDRDMLIVKNSMQKPARKIMFGSKIEEIMEESFLQQNTEEISENSLQKKIQSIMKQHASSSMFSSNQQYLHQQFINSRKNSIFCLNDTSSKMMKQRHKVTFTYTSPVNFPANSPLNFPIDSQTNSPVSFQNAQMQTSKIYQLQELQVDNQIEQEWQLQQNGQKDQLKYFPARDTFTSEKDLDPQILADLQKYSEQL